MNNHRAETKVGIFTLVTLVIIAVITLKVSDKTFLGGGVYDVVMVMDSATGINDKTPVEIAGIQVGRVKEVQLEESRRARVVLELKDDVVLTPTAYAVIKTKGFLGDTFINIMPGNASGAALKDNDQLAYLGTGGDINSMIENFNSIAKDVSEVAKGLRAFISTDKDAPFVRIMNNVDQLTKTLNGMVQRNETNVDAISENLASFSHDLRALLASRRGEVEASIDHLESITRKIDSGDGTVGKLINDPATADKINEAVDSLNTLLGGLSKLETEVGYHTEYLTQTDDFKHYVHLNLQPRPDERFMFEFVSDSNPGARRVSRTTQVTAGGTTSTVSTETDTIDRNAMRFSAQLAKDFYDFTVRGGLIESSGGMGVDYSKGPVDVKLSAYDFSSYANRKPHIKLTGDLNVTRNLYLLGGADDMLNPAQKTNWFMGAGVRFVDDDIKSLLGVGGGLMKGK